MKIIICLLLIAVQLSACSTYANRSASYRPPKEYANYQDFYGLKIGAESFSDKKLSEQTFGFDVRSAGLLPVQLVVNNKSGQTVELVAGQTLLIDGTKRYWKILTNREVVDRVKKTADAGAGTGNTGKATVQKTAASALMGLAIGIVSGKDVSSFVAKGGVTGSSDTTAANGAAKGPDDSQREMKLAEDIRNKGVEGKIMSAESLASGFIYFPGEISSVSELRLQVKFRDTGRLQTINLKLD